MRHVGHLRRRADAGCRGDCTECAGVRSNAIRMSAKGEECTFQIPGVCNGNPETTVLCHLPDESHGMGHKADDISAAYGCAACHDAIDSRISKDRKSVV